MNASKVALFLLVAAMAGSCKWNWARTNSDTKIFNGEPSTTSADFYPVVARFEMKEAGIWTNFCTGTLVDATNIITAAHCVIDMDGKKLEDFRVAFGLSKDDPDTQFANIESYDGHACYKNLLTKMGEEMDYLKLDYDIAVVKLAQPLESKIFGKNFPILGKPQLAPKVTVMAAGYGKTEKGTAGILYNVDLEIISLDFSSRQILARGDERAGKSVCSGDSGGPLFMKNSSVLELVGVTSWGPANNNLGDGKPCSSYSAFVRVSAHDSWLREALTGKPHQDFKVCPNDINPAKRPGPVGDQERGPDECRIALSADPKKVAVLLPPEKSNDRDVVLSAPDITNVVEFCSSSSKTAECFSNQNPLLKSTPFKSGKGRNCFRVERSRMKPEATIFFRARANSGTVIDQGSFDTNEESLLP